MLVAAPQHALFEAPAEAAAHDPEIDQEGEEGDPVVEGTLPAPSRVDLESDRRERAGGDRAGDGADVLSRRGGFGREDADRADPGIDLETGRVAGEDFPSPEDDGLIPEVVREEGDPLDVRMELVQDAIRPSAEPCKEQNRRRDLGDPPPVREHP